MSDEMNTKQEKEDMSFLSRKKAAWNDFRRLPKAEKKRRVIDCLLNNALYMLIFVFVIVVFIYNQRFLSFDSIVNITMQSASRLLMALGVAGIIVLTGTDLSAGRCLGLCACVCASLLQANGTANKMFSGLSFGLWLIPVALIISMQIRPAPCSLQSLRKARSVTPAIGASTKGFSISTLPIFQRSSMKSTP